MTNPAGWKTQRLDAIASTQLGKMLNKSKQTGKNTVPYLRSFNVQWGHFDMSDVNEMDIEPFEREKFSIRYGDLLVCEGGESGRVALWNQDYEIAFQNALHRVRAGNSISNKYLYYYFEWLVKNNLIDHLFNGVTIKHFPQGNLRSVQVSFPEDLKEQERIVEILEDHLSRLDAALADVKQAKLKAVSFRNSVLHEVFSGFLSIEKWEGFEVKNLGKWVTGSTPKSSNPANQGNKVPFLTPGDVSAYGKIELVERSISAIGADSVRRVTPPSVNLVCIGATLGKVGWTDKEITSNQQINSLVVDIDRHNPEFIMWLFSNNEMQRILWGASSSTTVPILNKGKLEKLKVSLPSLAEQTRLLVIIQEQISGSERFLKTAEVVEVESSALRRSLLQAAFTGQLTKEEVNV